MMKRLLLILGLAFVAFLATPKAGAQASGCGAEESDSILQPTDAIYEDALDLARILNEHHITIQCVLTSKLGGFFLGTKGAVLYRTADGDVGALFLPKPRTFADLAIVERPARNGFAYSFSGKPRPANAARLESDHRQFFLKRDNTLLILGDEALKNKLAGALNLPL